MRCWKGGWMEGRRIETLFIVAGYELRVAGYEFGFGVVGSMFVDPN